MTHTLIQGIEKSFINKKTPLVRPGYQVRVHQKIKEGNKERIQVFEGIVIGLNAGHGSSKTFTVRKVIQGIGVEKVFPMYSSRIAKIEVKKTFKTRRGKLTYLRKAEGLSKRLSAKLGLVEKDEILKQKKGLVEAQEAAMDEAVKKAEEEAKKEAEAKGEGKQTEVENVAEEKAPQEPEKHVKTEAQLQDEIKNEEASGPAEKEEAPSKQESAEEKGKADEEKAELEPKKEK